MRILRVLLALMVAGLVAAACHRAPTFVSETPSPGPSGAFRPTAATPQIAVDLLRRAWREEDEESARAAVPEEIVAALFRVSPRGWSAPQFTQGVFRLTKKGVPGVMEWRVQSVGGRYYVNVVQIPPIPLNVADLKGPVWGLYVAAGGSGYSQLSAAATQLQEIGLSTQAIGTLPASCQSSVAERLQIPSSFYTVVVFFERKAEAKDFEDDLGFPPLKVLKVSKLSC